MWLPLAEYSLKHKVSVSTLRRKIKAEDIEYRLDDGKYFILDRAISDNKVTTATPEIEEHRPSLKSDNTSTGPNTGPNTEPNNEHKSNEKESVITAANRLLTDLKKAYTQVLQEKESQILSLKEEISDLRTLVRVLESENQRLNLKHTAGYTVGSYDQDQDLDETDIEYFGGADLDSQSHR